MSYSSDFWRIIEEEEKKKKKKLDNIKIISNGVESGGTDNRYSNSFSDDLSKEDDFWSVIAEEEKKRNQKLDNIRFMSEEEEEDIAPLPSSKEDDKESELERINKRIAEIENDLGYNDSFIENLGNAFSGNSSKNWVKGLIDDILFGGGSRSALKDELEELKAQRDGRVSSSGETHGGGGGTFGADRTAAEVESKLGLSGLGNSFGNQATYDYSYNNKGEIDSITVYKNGKDSKEEDTTEISTDTLFGWAYSGKYNGKTYAEIQDAISKTTGRERTWLEENQYEYMSSAEAQKEIDYWESQLATDTKKTFGGATVIKVNDADKAKSADYDEDYVKEKISFYKSKKTLAERREKFSVMLSEMEKDKEDAEEVPGPTLTGEPLTKSAYGDYVVKGEKADTLLIQYRTDPQKMIRDSAQAIRTGGGDFNRRTWQFATQMTEDEYNNYLYFLGKYGEEKADEYLGYIEVTINARQAGVIVESVGDSAIQKAGLAIGTGLDQFGSGINALFSGADYIPPTATQIASAQVREGLKDSGPEVFGQSLGQVGYDFLTTTSNMLPSIAISAAADRVAPGSGKYVGSALMGASAAGHTKAELLNLGYSQSQATSGGLMVGVSEAGLQSLIGGITSLGGTASKGLTEKIASKVNNAIARAAITLGGSMAAEGFEEGLQTVLEPWLKEIATDVDWEDASVDDVLYSSLLGALSSVGIEGPGAVKNAVSGQTNLVTGLNANEKAVVNKEVENRIAEAEKDGKKLSNKDKNDIYDRVLKDLDKGYISTDTIEEVLGGDSYKTYQDTVKSEDALKSEFDELDKVKANDATLGQSSRYNELKNKLEELKTTSERDFLQRKYKNEAYEIARGSRLEESYNERARRGQAFTADLSKYDEKQRTVVQRAIDSGILNNTNRTREFVDIIARLSADKGVPFDFTNNAKLKESGFAIDGVTVNGYVTKDGITINMDSPKAWQSTVGHEITHILEGTELYTELQNAIVNYAKTKGDYQSRLDALTKVYEGVKDADINAELTADLVGDYLFQDEDFVNHLSTNHRNVFQKIYDEIKYLVKVTTAGTKEARELEKVKHAFEKAFRAQGKTQVDTKYSLSETTDGRIVAVVDSDILSKLDTSSWDDTKKETAKKAAVGALKQFSDGVVVDGIKRKVNRRSRREYTRSEYTEGLYKEDTAVFADKMRAADIVDDIVVATTNWNRDGGLKHPRDDNFVDFDHGNVLIVSGDRKYSAEVVVGITSQGEAVFYDLVDVNPATFDIKNTESSTTATTQNAPGDINEDSAGDIVPQTEGNVNRKFSLSDSDDSYSRIYDMQVEVNRLRDSIWEFEKTAEFKAAMDNLNKAIDSGDIDNGIKAYQKWRTDSGYDALVNRRDALNTELENLRKERDENIANRAIAEEKAAIAKSGLSETEYFRKQAVKEFGYTPYFYDAGYITPNGKMLNFSGEKGKHYGTRGQDHRAIGTIYAESEGTAALNRFVRDGNIRIMAESPGLDMSTIAEPTKEQYATIRKFASEYADKEYFSVDFTDESGKVIGSLTYENRINPTRIVNDIKHYYETGEIRQPSDLERFRYSLSKDTEGRELSSEQQDFFALAQTRDENGVLKPFYHGTRRADRVGTVFDPSRATSGPMAYFTDNRTIADHYARDKADTSLAYDSDYDSYETQFRVNRNGKDMSVVDLWYTLPMSERNAIKEKAKHITMDDDWDKVIYSEETQHGLGNFDAYELNRHRGNALHTLVDSWLTDGNIFGEEHKFLDVLKLVGIEDATYKDPDFRDEKTYEVYLNITNPFDTSNISEEMVGAFRQAAEEADFAPGNSADMWDKHNVDPDLWMERLEDDIKNGTTNVWTSIPDFVTDVLKAHGYDGIFDTGGKFGGEGHTVAIPFYSEQIKSVDNRTPTSNVDINLSLSENGGTQKTYGKFATPASDLRLETAQEDIAPVAEATENVQEAIPDDYAPMIENEALNGLTDEDAPPEYETPYYDIQRDAVTVDDKSLKDISKRTSETLGLGKADQKILEGIIQNYSQNENLTRDDLYSELKKNFSVLEDYSTNEEVVQLKKHLKNMRLYVSDEVKLDFGSGADGYSRFLRSNFGKLKIVKDRASGVPVDSAYMELSDIYPSYFPEDIINPADQLRKISEMASMSAEEYYPMELSDAEIEAVTDMVYTDISDYMNEMRLTSATEASHAPISDSDAPMVEIKTEPENKVLSVKELYEQKKNNYRNTLAAYEVGKEKALANFSEAIGKKLDEYNGLRNKNTKKAHNLLQQIENLRLRRDNVQVDYANRIAKQQARLEAFESKDYSEFENKELAFRRKDLHKQIVDKTKAQFEAQGYDLDEVLRSAKDLSTIATVDNTPQRVMEKSLGYKEGQILSDITVNKVAQNETEGIKWLNSFTNKKDGLLAKISKQYNIKPGSKESAAAQMYAEGFYVDKENNVVQYGDAELAKDFPDAKVRENIKGLAKDQRIREIYDETLAKINESRARNAYPEIPKLDNYFLHFRAMDDTFSRLGLPFNPNDIRAKDLPTDLNGVTADLKPGQPYFSSAMHRRGQRTSFDLLGGLEKYLSSAKNQIYHIDDIQTLRALRNYIADSYGQANGLEGLDALDEDIAQEKIKQVYGAHLSTFAKFLNEEANVIAGKTALIDRGLEGIVGRRAMTFMDTVNRQVGSNMVGYNVSSALTNLIAPVQAFAKTNKYDFIKGFAQTVSNKVNGIKGKSDGFAEASPVMIRRKGEERFHRTAWQKLSDPGYALMGAVDNFSTEIIARAKYNELTRKGMDSETAHVETDKWVSRLMGDRSLGQQPQLYNSKVLGLVTKFQLEVRNQLDSQFYDTIKEAEASTEDIQNGLERNAKKAAKIASTFFTLAVGQHVFGKVFESIAGYNPAFDIISVIAKAFGWDDDEEDEDTVLDNIEQAFFELMGDLPYTSILEGGRIPISSALPIEQLYQGKDQYGNEKSRLETIKETLPYYLMPGGYGQLKKTTQGLEMFNDDHPISGSYTDSGKLRFPVEDTLEEMFRAGLFGQYASSNARDYFDNERDALDEKKTQEFIDSGISIQDYWDYREGLKGLTTINEKADYIYGLDLPIDVKNLLINNLTDREEDIDLSGMEDFEDFEEFDFAVKNPEKYEWLTENGITVAEYEAMDKDTKEEYNYAFRNPEKYEFLKEIGVSYSDFAASDDVTKEGYDWAFKNPDKYKMSQAITEDFGEFYSYKKAMNEFDAKDENGETVSGLKKQRVADYISSLDIEYGRKLLLFKSQYPSDDSYNKEIVEYLDSRSDISYEVMVTILSSLGFRVNGNTVSWD